MNAKNQTTFNKFKSFLDSMQVKKIKSYTLENEVFQDIETNEDIFCTVLNLEYELYNFSFVSKKPFESEFYFFSDNENEVHKVSENVIEAISEYNDLLEEIQSMTLEELLIWYLYKACHLLGGGLE